MTESYIQLVDDTPNTGKKLRYRSRTVGANTVYEPYYINCRNERAVTYRGFGSSFRTVGNTLLSQGILALSNLSASGVYIGIRDITVALNSTAIQTVASMNWRVKVWTGNPTKGANAFTLTKASRDTALTSSASVELLGGSSSDGTAVSGGTAFFGGTALASWSFPARMHDLSGQVLAGARSLFPVGWEGEGIILRPGIGEAVEVLIDSPTFSHNAATNHYIVNLAWDEFTLP